MKLEAEGYEDGLANVPCTARSEIVVYKGLAWAVHDQKEKGISSASKIHGTCVAVFPQDALPQG